MNDVLYHKSMALCSLPYEKVQLKNTSAEGYLYQVIADTEADWVINIDEDAFVTNVDALVSLLDFCMENGYVNCGMPDGGVVHLRDGNPLVTNPYLNILNTKALREQFSADKDTIGLVLFGYAVMALVARLFSGYVVDSFPRKMVLLISFTVFTLFFVGYVAAGTLMLFAAVRTVHGMPFGFTTVANSTVAIDVLPSSRRTEGIGLYGLSNNLASAISPTVAIWIYTTTHNFDIIFWLAMGVAAVGLLIDATVTTRPRAAVKGKQPVSLDRFFLMKGLGEALTMVCFAFSYGVMSTYVAIYGKERLDIEGGSGTFFLLLSLGLILSRLQGGKSLREGKLTRHAGIGILISTVGYTVFVISTHPVCFYATAILVGLGNGHMWPAFQNMIISVAHHNERGTANSTLLTSWDLGMGLGIVLGGVIAEYFGYSAAFWTVVAVHVIGVVMYFACTMKMFIQRRITE